MNIVISSNSSWNIYNFRFNLIKALINKGYKITIVAPNDSYSKKIINLGCELISIHLESKNLSFSRSAGSERYLYSP